MIQKIEISMPITDVVKAWLSEQDYNDQIETNLDERSSIVKVLLNVEGNRYQLIIEVDEQKHIVSIFLYSTDDITESKLAVAWQWANEINSTLVMGRIAVCADLPFQFRQSIDLESGTLSTNMISNVVNYAIHIFESNNEQIAFTSSSNSEIILEDLSDAYSWSQIDGHEKLKFWSDEIKISCHKESHKPYWDMIGKGMILVNGEPDYCSKILKTVAKHADINYAIVGGNDILNLPSIKELEKLAPLIIYLKPGRWKRCNKFESEQETPEESEQFTSFRNKLIGWMAEFSPKSPVIFITSTGDLNEYVDEKLMRVGAFDLFMSLPEKSIELCGREFIKDLGEDLCEHSLTTNYGKIGHLVCSYDDRKRDLTLLALKRIHHDKKRKLEYIDLVDTDLHDLIEEGLIQEKDHHKRLQTAYHEAGHSLMNILEYEGQNVPDYTSILPGASGFGGVSVVSHGYLYKVGDDDTETFIRLRRRIRVLLGGRAGEEVLVGPEKISSGASNDLEKATQYARNAFSFAGFAPAMDEPGQSESNLTVIYGDPTETEYAHIEKLTREFLAYEYKTVRDKLNQNKIILEDIAKCLIDDPILDQNELAKICKKHKITVVEH